MDKLFHFVQKIKSSLKFPTLQLLYQCSLQLSEEKISPVCQLSVHGKGALCCAKIQMCFDCMSIGFLFVEMNSGGRPLNMGCFHSCSNTVQSNNLCLQRNKYII